MNNQNESHHGRRLVTVPALPAQPGYEWLSVPAMRHLIFQAEDRKDSHGSVIPGNGLAKTGAIIRIGRKVLIDLDRFDDWLDDHRVLADVRQEGT